MPIARPQRAAALPPDQRRAEIVAATVPLLEEHGAELTTRQIAEAAGLAEGTLFRAFPDKEAIIQAALEAVLDPAPLAAAIEGIDPALPLDDRLEEAVAVLQARVSRLWQLITVVGKDRVLASRHPVDLDVLAALFEPDRHRLRRTPRQAAVLLRGLTVAGTHPALVDDAPLAPAEVVAVLLDGVRAPC